MVSALGSLPGPSGSSVALPRTAIEPFADRSERAGETAQQLQALAALAEGPGLTAPPITPVLGDPVSTPDLGHEHTHGPQSHICTNKTVIHIK